MRNSGSHHLHTAAGVCRAGSTWTSAAVAVSKLLPLLSAAWSAAAVFSNRGHASYMECCSSQQVRHCCTVIQMEVSNKGNINIIKVLVRQKGQAVTTLEARMNATVEHDLLAPAQQPARCSCYISTSCMGSITPSMQHSAKLVPSVAGGHCRVPMPYRLRLGVDKCALLNGKTKTAGLRRKDSASTAQCNSMGTSVLTDIPI